MKSELKHSELTFQLIVEAAPNALILVNKEGKIAFANSNAELLFGYKRSEMIGRGIEMLIPARFTPNHPGYRDSFFHSPNTRMMGAGRDLFALKKDGTEFPVEIGLNPLVTVEGTMVVAAIIDITDRKEAEERTRQSEIRFQALVENEYSITTLMNEKFETVYRSPSSETILGFSHEERITIAPDELTHPDEKEYHRAKMQEVLASPGKPIHLTIRSKHKNGNYRWLEGVSVNKLGDPSVQGIVSNFRDITERKEFEEQQALFASIINSSDDAILSKTMEGIITSWNAGAERLFGYAANEVIGKNVSILIPPDRINEEPKIIESIKKGEHVKHYETERLRKNGSHVFISLTVSPIKDKTGKIIGASKIARDITEKKEAEKKILKGSRLYSFLSHINQSIVHKHDEQSLFDEACRIAVSFGKFELAWIGLIDEKNKRENVVAQTNAATGHPELLSYLPYDEDGPMIKIIRSGKYYLCNDAMQEPEGSLSKEYLRRHNFGSFITLPINKSGKTIGTFNIFSSDTFAFDDDEISLLVEATGDISFALNGFEREKLLTQSESRLKEAQKIAHLGDWEFDFNTQKVTWSDENFRIYGFEPDSIEPSRELAQSFVHPDDKEKIRAEIEDAQSSFKPFTHFRRIIRKDGKMRHIYATGKFFLDKENKPLRFFGTALDVTEITEKEEELRNSELKFRDFFENAPEAMTITNMTDGKFIGYNNNALKLLKYSPEELLAKGPVDISPPFQPDGSHSTEKAMEYIMIAINGGKPVFEWVCRDADGHDFISEIRITKLSGTNENKLLASFVDITERKNNELERGKITADLLQRNKDLEQFTYIVSHNLRAPVANILGITDLLQSGGLDKKEEEMMIGDLSTSVTRLDTVIKDLNYILQLKRDVTENREVIKFSKLVDDIKASIADLIKNENAEITYNFHEADEMLTMKSYIYSVFFNLISNSIKYRQPNMRAVIDITSAKVGNNVILTFKDNGLGIDLKKKGDQVFGLYKRFHTHTEGKGMGLYMTKTQVEIIGGTISIASEVNKGTEFKIEFYSNNER